ncbi:MAG: acyl-CoA dehydrogenase family protein [Alphaproteobacteria bacterium]|nr:acyl-CoA dehydrogenase family protein [Alphaproteobacteria bacterium]
MSLPPHSEPRPDHVATFLQEGPLPVDLYLADDALRDEIARRVPAELRPDADRRLSQLGHLTAGPLWTLSRQAEAEQPELLHYDPWGRRIDAIKVSPAWDALAAVSAQHGIVATGYDDALGVHARVVQAGLIHLFSATSAIFSCPLAMTDAAARVLLDIGPDTLRDRLVPRLLSDNPETFITSGQWMTERPGGSDVGRTETIAVPTGDGDPHYTLHGVKWFTSATTSEMALTLARVVDADGNAVPGSRGLTMFLVEVERAAHGGLDGIQVRRLKDKLGTKALPTAELSLDGLQAHRLGPIGRGVPSISTMLHITRYWNSCSSSSAMAQATFLARDYATRREAFGRPIIEHPLHQRTLADMEAETAGALALCMEIASLLGRHEHGQLSEADAKVLRALLPVTKLTTGKQAVAVTSEGLEAFGGAGYVEDTGLPRMLRDAQVLPIWEGTTNVLSLDLLRAEAKEGALSAMIGALGRRVAALDRALGPEIDLVAAVFQSLAGRLAELAEDGDRAAMEWEARRIGLATGHLWQATLLAETATHAGSDAAAARFRTFSRNRLGGPLA